ncbi:MAG: hypothetical protein QOF30_390 [Acidimicrobiaceae bacterium]|jgi:hypothetical protein|nr:hypothetical protein [Acidimicrobiaceae bacterium]
MPFLGPVIAAWIVLIVGTMAAYYLLVVRYDGPKEAGDPPEWRRPMPAEPPERTAPWVQPSRPAPARPELTAYDMENFPDEQWGRSSLTS